jgi:Ohr subfamily peroxiredoxin
METDMTQIEKVIYTAKVHTTGGRDGGTSRTSDGRLDVRLTPPGARGEGTNPEQLFAAGWSSCFLSAIKLEAAATKVRLPADAAVDAEVDLGTTYGQYFLQARLNVSRQPAGRRRPDCPESGGRCAPEVPVLQGRTRKHQCRDDGRRHGRHSRGVIVLSHVAFRKSSPFQQEV